MRDFNIVIEGFGNRLGFLKKAINSKRDAKIYLKKYYKSFGRLDIHDKDVSLLDFYYNECHAGIGFDDAKFEAEAKKRIKGDAGAVAETSEQIVSLPVVTITETPEQVFTSSTAKKDGDINYLDVEGILAGLVIHELYDAMFFLNYKDMPVIKVFSHLMRNKLTVCTKHSSSESVDRVVLLFTEKHRKLIEEIIKDFQEKKDDIPF